MKILVFITLFLFILACTSKKTESSDPTDSITLKTEVPDSVDYLSIGMVLVRDEEFGGLKNELSFDQVRKLFGDAESQSEITYSEADGMNWQTLFYPGKGLEISLYQNEDKSWSVGSYLLKENATLKSMRGIGIGSTDEEVKQAYKKEIETVEVSGQIIAGSVYGGIVFWMTEDGHVRNIFVGASAE